MKQAVMTAPGKILIQEVETPQPGPGEVLLRIQRIGVCGSDIHVFHGKHPYTNYPVVQGHEFSATIKSLGPGVTGVELGMIVTTTPQIVCGKCNPCQSGNYHICDHLKVEGFQAPGCAQEFWVTAAEKIVILPEHFTYEQGAMVEPVAVAVHAISRAGSLDGRNIAVLGAGPIGNLVAQVAKSAGANVLITDLSDYRLGIAKKCGLKAISNVSKETLNQAVDRVFGSTGIEFVFECVGVEDTMTAAIEKLQKGGTIVVVGVFGDKPRLDLGLVQDRELNIHGTLMYQRKDYEHGVALMASGQVNTKPLYAKHFPLENYLAAYEYIESQKDQTMKVFIDLN